MNELAMADRIRELEEESKEFRRAVMKLTFMLSKRDVEWPAWIDKLMGWPIDEEDLS